MGENVLLFYLEFFTAPRGALILHHFRYITKEELFMNSRNDPIQKVVIGGLLAAVVL